MIVYWFHISHQWGLMLKIVCTSSLISAGIYPNTLENVRVESRPCAFIGEVTDGAIVCFQLAGPGPFAWSCY